MGEVVDVYVALLYCIVNACECVSLLLEVYRLIRAYMVKASYLGHLGASHIHGQGYILATTATYILSMSLTK